MPAISTSKTSPSLRKRGGSKPTPTPSGVPVAITSPGDSVTLREMAAISVRTSKIRSAVLLSWRSSPFTRQAAGDLFSRPTAGGGGYGDPLDRDPERVVADVADDYVSLARAAKDYGVVLEVIDKDLCEYEVDRDATERLRASIRAQRRAWVDEAPETVAAQYRAGEIDALDAVRRYAVILDWGSGEPLPRSTAQFREQFRERSLSHWS